MTAATGAKSLEEIHELIGRQIILDCEEIAIQVASPEREK
jgi:hypothetical protein